MKKIRAKPIAQVHHSSGSDIGRSQKVDDFFAGFGFQKAADNIRLIFQIRLYTRAFQVYFFLSFQIKKANVGSTQIAANADEITFFSAIAFYKFVGAYFSNGGN